MGYNEPRFGRSYLDGARSDLYGLKDDIERKILDDKKVLKRLKII